MTLTEIGKIICDYCIADECPDGCHRDEPRCVENQSQATLILKAHNAVIREIFEGMRRYRVIETRIESKRFVDGEPNCIIFTKVGYDYIKEQALKQKYGGE